VKLWQQVLLAIGAFFLAMLGMLIITAGAALVLIMVLEGV
jgi:hypothetical protein